MIRNFIGRQHALPRKAFILLLPRRRQLVRRHAGLHWKALVHMPIGRGSLFFSRSTPCQNGRLRCLPPILPGPFLADRDVAAVLSPQPRAWCFDGPRHVQQRCVLRQAGLYSSEQLSPQWVLLVSAIQPRL
mmetsp:Transcript_35709/g.98436  ORF Transcript_35709/g.98436 Transcript_35709/m.98436 type:complete len:131 (+) Transcript_35709:61-453(+)